ncbi:hypothetical protein C8Q78DRAFT_460000 [Trametes maxima]|nr:hypothetical protein C8Q78DRAFT_460000 [Trametes maxima]
MHPSVRPSVHPKTRPRNLMPRTPLPLFMCEHSSLSLCLSPCIRHRSPSRLCVPTARSVLRRLPSCVLRTDIPGPRFPIPWSLAQSPAPGITLPGLSLRLLRTKECASVCEWPGRARLWIPPAGAGQSKCISTCSLVVYMVSGQERKGEGGRLKGTVL